MSTYQDRCSAKQSNDRRCEARMTVRAARRSGEVLQNRFITYQDARRVNGEFYTCPVYNYMITSGAKIGIYEINYDSMSGIGTPNDLESYLQSIGAPASSDSPSSS